MPALLVIGFWIVLQLFKRDRIHFQCTRNGRRRLYGTRRRLRGGLCVTLILRGGRTAMV